MRGWLGAALLSSLAVCAAQDDCALSAGSATPPDGVAELRARLAASFAEYSEGEVAAARKARNQMRVAAPRVLDDPDLFGSGLELSARFCGLRYGNSSRSVCVPVRLCACAPVCICVAA